MQTAVATANLYYRPFQEALEIISVAGFDAIELDLYWERAQWAVAQHLKGWTAQATVHAIRDAGLQIASIHDGGGVLTRRDAVDGFVSPELDRYLDQIGVAPQHVIFHTPHVEGACHGAWWPPISGGIAGLACRYAQQGAAVSIENMPTIAGYSVPMTAPEELAAFLSAHGLFATLDCSHYAYQEVDLLRAAKVLGTRLRTVHLSDYRARTGHVFIGDGELPLQGLLNPERTPDLQLVTLECSLGHYGEDVARLGKGQLTERLREAGEIVGKRLTSRCS